MRVIYSRRNTLPSALIRWMTWSRWSHVSVAVSETMVIDARAIGGVRYRSLEELTNKASRFEFVDLALPDEAAAMQFLRAQVGRRYDWGMVLGVVWRSSRWHDNARWACSELVAAAIEAGRLALFRREAWRITPEHLWMVR
jgi:uncharacterized protein YycO